MDRSPARRFASVLIPLLMPILSLAPLAAFASDDTNEAPAAPPAESTEGSEDERREFDETVVVTATRTPVPADEIGSSVSVLDAERLERRGARLVADALRRVPGVDVRRTGGPGSATSVFLRGTDSDHTLVLLDGIELNDPSSPNRAAVLGDLTLDGLDRIEVLRGPQSTLYGSDAVGGVIQLFTRRGAGDPRTDVRVEGGSYGTLGLGVASSGGGERASYSVSASRWTTDGFSAATGGVEDDAYDNSTLSGRLGWGDPDGSGVDVVARWVDGSVDFDGFDAEAGNRIDSRETLARLAPRLVSADGRLRQRWGVALARHRRDTTSAAPSLIEGELFSVDWQADLALGARHTLSGGLASEWETAELSGQGDGTRSIGAFVQDRVSGAHWFGTAGVRLDDHADFGSESTFRLAGGRRFGDGRTIVRASAGSGYKAPSLTELSASAFAGNPDLEPETSLGADLGVERRTAGGRAALRATLFATRIDELIVAVFDPGTGLFRNVNVDEADSTGVELGLDLDPRGPLSVAASYTWNDTEARGTPQSFGLQPGSRLLRRPEHRGGVEFDLAFPSERGHAFVAATWVGDRADVDPATFAVVEAPSYVVVDAAAQVALGAALRLELRVDNLLDEDYEEVLGFATAGRSGYAGLRYAF